MNKNKTPNTIKKKSERKFPRSISLSGTTPEGDPTLPPREGNERGRQGPSNPLTCAAAGKRRVFRFSALFVFRFQATERPGPSVWFPRPRSSCLTRTRHRAGTVGWAARALDRKPVTRGPGGQERPRGPRAEETPQQAGERRCGRTLLRTGDPKCCCPARRETAAEAGRGAPEQPRERLSGPSTE